MSQIKGKSVCIQSAFRLQVLGNEVLSKPQFLQLLGRVVVGRCHAVSTASKTCSFHGSCSSRWASHCNMSFWCSILPSRFRTEAAAVVSAPLLESTGVASYGIYLNGSCFSVTLICSRFLLIEFICMLPVVYPSLLSVSCEGYRFTTVAAFPRVDELCYQISVSININCQIYVAANKSGLVYHWKVVGTCNSLLSCKA